MTTNKKKFGSKDYFVISISFCAFLAACWFYYQNWQRSRQGSTEKIATLIETSGNAKRFAKNAQHFAAIGQGDPVFNQDTLVTDSETQLRLKLEKENREVALNPNSLVRLFLENGIVRFQIVTGTITNAEK